MARFIICNFEQFVHIIQPIIKKYAIEQNECLTAVIKKNIMNVLKK